MPSALVNLDVYHYYAFFRCNIKNQKLKLKIQNLKLMNDEMLLIPNCLLEIDLSVDKVFMRVKIQIKLLIYYCSHKCTLNSFIILRR